MGTLRFAGKHLADRWCALTILLALSAGSPVVGQTSADGTPEGEQSPYLEPIGDGGPETSGPQVAFHLAAEISLPGPLPGPGPRLREGRIRTPVAGGVAVTDWAEGSEVLLEAAATVEVENAELAWSVAPDGRIRVTMIEQSRLLAQKKCRRCRAGWKKKWKLRVSGTVPAPPLVTNDRVFYGALDNRVYSVKRKNGHRVWVADVDGRASRRLRIWRGTVARLQVLEATPWEGTPMEVILVVPENGSGIVALDAETGLKVASFTLPEDEGWLVGAPLLTPDGKIVIARQKYAPSDASLMVFHIVELSDPGETEETDL
jgi:hypothetical protein